MTPIDVRPEIRLVSNIHPSMQSFMRPVPNGLLGRKRLNIRLEKEGFVHPIFGVPWDIGYCGWGGQREEGFRGDETVCKGSRFEAEM